MPMVVKQAEIPFLILKEFLPPGVKMTQPVSTLAQ